MVREFDSSVNLSGQVGGRHLVPRAAKLLLPQAKRGARRLPTVDEVVETEGSQPPLQQASAQVGRVSGGESSAVGELVQCRLCCASAGGWRLCLAFDFCGWMKNNWCTQREGADHHGPTDTEEKVTA
jgi:hypothetical protein